MHKVERVGFASCFVHEELDFIFSLTHEIQTVEDVFFDCARKEYRFLLDDSDLIVEPFWVQFFHIFPIKENFAHQWIIKAFNK